MTRSTARATAGAEPSAPAVNRSREESRPAPRCGRREVEEHGFELLPRPAREPGVVVHGCGGHDGEEGGEPDQSIVSGVGAFDHALALVVERAQLDEIATLAGTISYGAMAGALLGLYLFGQTLNLYSQIGLIMLVGLAAKNGILIVEFANQLRDRGRQFEEALLVAAEVRLRPIVMTGITTAAGSIPLLLSAGPGAETRSVIGIVIISGVLAATVFTLFVVPVAYSLFARHTGSPGDVKRRLRDEMEAVVAKVTPDVGAESTDGQAMK